MEDVEDNEFVAQDHDRLISAISKLDKTRYIHIRIPNESTYHNLECNSLKSNKEIDNNSSACVCAYALRNTAHHVEIGKKLKKNVDVSKVLPKRLEKPHVERIKRVTGYEETKKKLGRWDPVVARNLTVDCISFPLKQVENKLQPTEEFIKRFELKSELEKELEEIEPAPQIEEEDEEEHMYPMSYEEMLEHRQHMAKLRAQQSYKAAKAKRQSKIKSKKYHRILKKEKLKQQLKEFEELQKTNPEEALKKLESLEKARALERHTLRHKNTGKWARSQTIRAKYNKEVRQQLAEQLAVSRGLTQKTQIDDSSDESEGNDNIPDMSLSQDPMNPWVIKTSNVDAEFEFGYKKYIKEKMFKCKDSDSESDQDAGDDLPINKNLNTLAESTLNINDENCQNYMSSVNNESSDLQLHQEKPVTAKTSKNLMTKRCTPDNKKSKTKVKTIIATSNWSVEPLEIKNHITPQKDISSAFASLENKISIKVETKLKRLRKSIEKLENSYQPKVAKKGEQKDEQETLKYLQFKNKKLKPIIDEELIENVHKNMEDALNDKSPLSLIKDANKLSKDTIQSTTNVNSDLNIDFTKFPKFKPKHLNTVLSEDAIGLDDLDDDEQVVPKLNIEEVFEEEDVVASFRQEKEDEINKNKAQDIDCTLPGWGSWVGKGVKAPKRKNNRFILKGAEVTPRRDENKGDVIIIEHKDPKLGSHKLTDVPFPFKGIKEYEASIRAPIGNTFIPEKAHKKLIKPCVITRAGTIIEPMDEDELLVKRNSNFKNKDVIKFIAKK